MKRIWYMILVNLYRVPYMLFCILKYSNRKKNYPIKKRYAYIHRFVPWANRGGHVDVIATGQEKLPTDRNYIMFPNHQGLFDTLTMLEVIDTQFSIVAKKELEKVFLLKNILDMLGAEYMDRSDIRQSMKVIQNIAARVRAGENFAIYPEGTRSKQGNSMLEFKAGAFKSATIAKCDIVPVALVDCYKPFDEASIKPVTCQVHFLDPIPYEEYKDMKSHEIAAMVQERIRLKITEVTGIESQIVTPVQ